MDEAKGIDLLVVDDDPDFRGTVARRFLRRGYRVHEASDGAEALDMADRRDIDVAILDMIMPGMSGLELLKKLKAAVPECEAIMLTGQGTVESAVEAMKLGAVNECHELRTRVAFFVFGQQMLMGSCILLVAADGSRMDFEGLFVVAQRLLHVVQVGQGRFQFLLPVGDVVAPQIVFAEPLPVLAVHEGMTRF